MIFQMVVLSDISSFIGSEFQVDDIERVLAVRFSGVFLVNKDMYNIPI
ncbi:hypothetical protein GF386_05510 [Candidatus Pacearchaeota archaeon]|nr:hypothetical protein [Candidatus Pacearchaeota archaeon]MBD3283557.1 hypothetical protein [Candidatus Pacearchaeota archaeon]